MAYNLPLLPKERYFEGLEIIKRKIDQEPEEEKPKLNRFYNYLKNYWGKKIDKLCVGHLVHRTNNLNESANHRLFERLGGLHPRIWHFIGKINLDYKHNWA